MSILLPFRHYDRNIENVARDCAVGRTTVQTCFEIVEDTLIGFRLPTYRADMKVKEASHPKFYFFDPGVARACADLVRSEIESGYRGFLFETLMLGQIRAYNSYSGRELKTGYYKVSGGYEIDLIVEAKKKTAARPAEVICIEFKSARKWDRRWNKPVDDFAELGKLKVRRKIGVYLGNERLKAGGFEVWPAEKFLDELFSGGFF